MASLRDVLNHIGQPVEIRRGNTLVATVQGTERAGIVLLEPTAEPRAGDELRFVGSGRRVRVAAVRAETHQKKVDHYRADVQPM